jgi:hypothetical protein
MGLFRKKDKKKVKESSPFDILTDIDKQVLYGLMQAGSDLSKPHNLEHCFFFPSKALAAQAVQKLVDLGLQNSIIPPEGDLHAWTVISTQNIVPTPEAIAQNTIDLNEIAASLGGEYDGWGTMVVK